MKDYLTDIVQQSLGSTPEELLKTSLQACISLSGADGGSILGEEGPYLQFLFSDVPELIGKHVPFDSIAGVCTRDGRIIYTYAPADERHFDGIDSHLKRETRYLLSIPIPSILPSNVSDRHRRTAGALQLLFGSNVMPGIEHRKLPLDFGVDEFSRNEVFEEHFKQMFFILPIIAFGIEVMQLRQTSYQVIHELKNKMISGQSWLNYLKDDLAGEYADALQKENIREDFSLAESAVREGSELAKSYLQFTRLYAPSFQPCDVNEVLAEAAASARALGSELKCGNLKVALEAAPDMPAKNLDAGQLKMVFFNLCKNAVEAMARCGSAAPQLTIRSSVKAEGAVEISVGDNGPGMPREIADNLFVPFKTKKEGGTGLGLAIAKKIIDIHGGAIRCETGSGGTRFVIVI